MEISLFRAAPVVPVHVAGRGYQYLLTPSGINGHDRTDQSCGESGIGWQLGDLIGPIVSSSPSQFFLVVEGLLVQCCLLTIDQ